MARKGAITSKQFRSANYSLRFWIDEAGYVKDAPRRFSKETTVDGTLISDYGFHEGDRVLTVGNVKLSESEVTALRDMQADNTNDYMFSDGVNLWEVLLRSVTIASIGSHSIVSVTMNVVEKVV